MKITKEKLLRIINEEIESIKEVEMDGPPMDHQGQEFKTGLGRDNTWDDYMDAPPTIEERVSDLIMAELEETVKKLSSSPEPEGGLEQIDDDLMAIAMRIRDNIMPQIGPIITGALVDAQAALEGLAAKIQKK